MHRTLTLAAIALAALPAAASAQYPWDQQAHDPLAHLRSPDPYGLGHLYGQGQGPAGFNGDPFGRPYGGSPYQRPMTQAERVMAQQRVTFQPPAFRRDEAEEQRRQQAMLALQVAGNAAQNVDFSKLRSGTGGTKAAANAASNAATEASHLRPSASWGRGWLTGIGASIAAAFGAIFRWRRKE